jgi:anti-anti-sigma factor
MNPGALTISTTLSGDTATVRVLGEIDLASVAEVVDAVTQASPPGGHLELDLRDVGFIDSAGIAGLNRCRRSALGAGTGFAVRARRDGDVARLLEWTGLHGVIDVRLDDDAPTVGQA